MSRDTIFRRLVARGWTPEPDTVLVFVDEVVEYGYRRAEAGEPVNTKGHVIRPPYAVTWLEAPGWGEHMRRDAALDWAAEAIGGSWSDLLTRYLARLQMMGIAFASVENVQRLGPNGVLLTYYLPDNGGRDIGMALCEADEHWRYTARSVATLFEGGDDTDRPLEELEKDFTSELVPPALLALGFFHVHGATVTDVTTRSQRRQAEREQRPLVRSHELVVEPLRRVLQAARSAPGGPSIPLAQHLCRGHFKTFTADAPLLGRHVGTYWWEPFLRGDPEAGVVLHPHVVLKEPA